MTELQKPGALPKRCGAYWTKQVEGCPRGAWDPSSRWNAEILSICLLLNHINQCILSYGRIHVDTTYTLVYYYPQYIFFGILALRIPLKEGVWGPTTICFASRGPREALYNRTVSKKMLPDFTSSRYGKSNRW